MKPYSCWGCDFHDGVGDYCFREEKDQHFFRACDIYRKQSIPKRCVKCPDCKGDGEIQIGYDGGHDKDFMSCILCSGKGYLTRDNIDSWKRIGSIHAKTLMIELESILKESILKEKYPDETTIE